MPRLSRILVYPFKSLDGQEVQQAELLPGGALVNDRRFALTNRQGDLINGKTTPALHRLRSHYDPAAGTLTLDLDGLSSDSEALQRSQLRLSVWHDLLGGFNSYFHGELRVQLDERTLKPRADRQGPQWFASICHNPWR